MARVHCKRTAGVKHGAMHKVINAAMAQRRQHISGSGTKTKTMALMRDQDGSTNTLHAGQHSMNSIERATMLHTAAS
eukprot:2854784-Alexandrium_andersonii.AAC.1